MATLCACALRKEHRILFVMLYKYVDCAVIKDENFSAEVFKQQKMINELVRRYDVQRRFQVS